MLRLGRRAAVAAEQVLEIVTPRTNAAHLTSAEHVFSALVNQRATDPTSLEIVADRELRRQTAAGPAAGDVGAEAPEPAENLPF